MMFRDVNGKLSSKRVISFSMVALSIVGGVIGAVIGNSMLVDYAKWLVLGGVAEGISSVAERKA